MIALRNNIPLVAFDDGSVMTFESAWLHRSLRYSARQAGYDAWWPAEHVTESILKFLTHEYGLPTVTCEDLNRAVRVALDAIGFSDIAKVFQSRPPPVHLSLAQIAREAGTGYELFFFGILRERLHAVFASPMEYLEISGLRPCVKTLRSARYWQSSCSLLCNEIVEFIRLEMDSASHSEDLHLRLS